MRKKITMFSCAFALLFPALALLACGVAMAGPAMNAQQFQQKAAKTAARGISDVTARQRPVDVKPAITPEGTPDESAGLASDKIPGQPVENSGAPAQEAGAKTVEEKPAGEKPAEEKVAEEEKIKIEVSEKEIDARVPSYKKSLQDIIRDADANIKRIDSQLKAEDDERGAKEHYGKGDELYKDGKFEEASKEWNTALGLAKDPDFRKRIRESLKRSARQTRQAKEKREAEEWAKKKAELRGKPQPAQKTPEAKQKTPESAK